MRSCVLCVKSNHHNVYNRFTTYATDARIITDCFKLHPEYRESNRADLEMALTHPTFRIFFRSIKH